MYYGYFSNFLRRKCIIFGCRPSPPSGRIQDGDRVQIPVQGAYIEAPCSGYIVMLRTRMFRSLIPVLMTKERNIRARNITKKTQQGFHFEGFFPF